MDVTGNIKEVGIQKNLSVKQPPMKMVLFGCPKGVAAVWRYSLTNNFYPVGVRI